MREVVIGDCRLILGDCLEVLPTLAAGSVDAVVTDPPYSSGGFTRSDKNQDVASKYVQSGTEIIRSAFSGDNRDGRSWCYWMALWLSACARATKVGGYCLSFSDWRQLPLATDAIQSGGFIWRGVICWDKGLAARAPHCGYFRHQCEYVVWGTNGPSKIADWGGPWPGCFSIPVLQSDKHHITGKPSSLMAAIVSCMVPGGLILDPFMGSGTTGVACVKTGRKFVGVEIDPHYFDVACQRIQEAYADAELFSPPAVAQQMELIQP